LTMPNKTLNHVRTKILRKLAMMSIMVTTSQGKVVDPFPLAALMRRTLTTMLGTAKASRIMIPMIRSAMAKASARTSPMAHPTACPTPETIA